VVAAIITLEQLHEHMYNCFQFEKNARLDHDLDAEAIRDKHFHATALQGKRPEHVWGTYNWSQFLLDETNPRGRAFAEISNIAQLRDPDVYRPHCFVFSMMEQSVVLNIKHWTSDTSYWNEEPFKVWQRIPDLADLHMCPLEGTEKHTSEYLKELYNGLASCNSGYERTGRRCGDLGAGRSCPRCDNGKNGNCACKPCHRCDHVKHVGEYLKLSTAIDIQEADLLAWHEHFDRMNDDYVRASLPADMQLPLCARLAGSVPTVAEQIAALPSKMKPAPANLKLKLKVLNGWGPKKFRVTHAAHKAQPTHKADATGRKVSSMCPGDVEAVVAATRSSTGRLEYAVVFFSGEGMWVTAADLEAYRQECLAKEMLDPFDVYFGAGMQVEDMLVQELNKRMYRARATEFHATTSLWQLNFPKQSDDRVFGSWACNDEVQLVDIRSLRVHDARTTGDTSPKGTEAKLIAMCQGEPREITLPACMVHIEAMPALGPLPLPTEFHLFWVSRGHFDAAFIQRKLGPMLLSVRGEPIDLDKIGR
jgi:hypothetical protein